MRAGLTPVVPEYGSLGASGDLAPLAHCALVLIGEGSVVDADGAVVPAADALARAGIEPIELTAKEGLALINGTDGMLGMLVLALCDLEALLRVADVAAAMSVEALLGTDRVFAEDLHRAAAAARAGGECGESAAVAGGFLDRRQPSLRRSACAGRVLAAVRAAGAWSRSRRGGVRSGVASVELRSAIDNPMVLADGRVESCGNFHGAPVGMACDFLAIAAAQVGAIAERRTDRLLDATRSHGLPPFLAASPGVDSGLMIAGYTQAALVAENRRLAAPASVDSLPTSAMQEDHVSMGWGAARKLRLSVANLGRIVAVELACAARGLDLRAPLLPAAGTAAALSVLRSRVPGPGPDRWTAPELAAVESLVASGAVLAAVEEAIGPLT